MTTIAIETESRRIEEILPKDHSSQPIYLTREGKKEFIIVPFDEGDEEVLAARQNPELMSYLDECIERAKTRPTRTLAEVKAALLTDENE